jgi:hypothetical protein
VIDCVYVCMCVFVCVCVCVCVRMCVRDTSPPPPAKKKKTLKKKKKVVLISSIYIYIFKKNYLENYVEMRSPILAPLSVQVLEEVYIFQKTLTLLS